MKKIILILSLMAFSTAALAVPMESAITVTSKSSDMKTKKEIEGERLCNLFTEKVHAYEATMRDDRYAKVTLKSYKTRADSYCIK